MFFYKTLNELGEISSLESSVSPRDYLEDLMYEITESEYQAILENIESQRPNIEDAQDDISPDEFMQMIEEVL